MKQSNKVAGGSIMTLLAKAINSKYYSFTVPFWASLKREARGQSNGDGPNSNLRAQ